MTASQTNEQALESAIEKRLTGTCLEELVEQGINLDIATERSEIYQERERLFYWFSQRF